MAGTRIALGLVFFALASLKFFSEPAATAEWSPAYHLLVVAATLVELLLGAGLVAGFRPRGVARCALAFALALTVWQLVLGPGGGVGARTCGCFGPLKLGFLDRLTVSAVLVILTGAHYAMIRPRDMNVAAPRA